MIHTANFDQTLLGQRFNAMRQRREWAKLTFSQESIDLVRLRVLNQFVKNAKKRAYREFRERYSVLVVHPESAWARRERSEIAGRMLKAEPVHHLWWPEKHNFGVYELREGNPPSDEERKKAGAGHLVGFRLEIDPGQFPEDISDRIKRMTDLEATQSLVGALHGKQIDKTRMRATDGEDYTDTGTTAGALLVEGARGQKSLRDRLDRARARRDAKRKSRSQ